MICWFVFQMSRNGVVVVRYTLLAAVFGALITAQQQGTHRQERVVLYASVGPELAQYDVDIDKATLTKRGSVMLPANIQYAWPHPSHQYLYVAWSNGGPSYGAAPGAPGPSGSQHGLSAFRIDPASGSLIANGPPAALPSRPIHVTVDIPGTHVLTAYNDPSGVTVHNIGAGGTVGTEVKQPAPLDLGVYAHQVRVAPSNKMVILVTRGNGPARDKPEDPGALKVFHYDDGVLTDRASIAPGGGFNFQPRHLDFHPAKPWIFVSLERQSQLHVYEMRNDQTLGPQPLFIKSSLAGGAHSPTGQAAGTIHMHPNGRFVYQANRAGGTTDFQGKPVFAGGENTIAVYSVDQNTGEPALIQNADTRGAQPRTFSLDPSGRILVAANQSPIAVRDGMNVKTVPAGLAVFRIREDGKLDFVRKYDVEVAGGRTLFWMGMVGVPAR